MNKKHIALACIVVLFINLAFAVSAEPAEGTITLEEAKSLLSLSSTAFDQVHRNGEDWWNDGEHWLGNVPEQYNTKEKMSKYFKEIYSEDIADTAWMYAFSPSYTDLLSRYPTSIDENGRVLIYKEKADGTIDLSDEVSTGGGWTYGYSWIGAEKQDYFFDCESIFDINGNSSEATAKIIIVWIRSDLLQLYQTEVAFRMTKNGWRISDCDYFRKMHSDVTNPGVADYPFIADLLDNNKYWELQNGNLQMEMGFKFIAIETDRVAGIQKYWNKAKQCEEWYSIEMKKRNGEWMVSGGTVLDLLSGNENVSPYTGDNSTYTIALLSALGIASIATVMLVLKKKKYTSD